MTASLVNRIVIALSLDICECVTQRSTHVHRASVRPIDTAHSGTNHGGIVIENITVIVNAPKNNT